MNSLTYDNIQELSPEQDIYDNSPVAVDQKPKELALSDIPQGAGSRLDSDTVDGLQAVTATKAAANRLVATGSDGLLPTGIVPAPIPAPSWSGIIFGRDGITRYLLVVEDNGALSLDPL